MRRKGGETNPRPLAFPQMADHPAPPASGAATTCAACGNALKQGARFCSHCGASTDAGSCPSCGSPLSAGARFCHKCGTAQGTGSRGQGTGARERVAWIVAGLGLALAVLAFLWRGNRPPAPDMGSAGAATGLSTRAPDISAMSPEERFFRLWDRIERAAAAGDTATIIQFAPMALGAYAMLDSVDNDQRFHAALIDLATGDFPAALARADTMLITVPGHLFAYLIRGEVADRRNDVAALGRTYRDFLARYDAELASGKTEYTEHRPLLDDFRVRARATGGRDGP